MDRKNNKKKEEKKSVVVDKSESDSNAIDNSIPIIPSADLHYNAQNLVEMANFDVVSFPIIDRKYQEKSCGICNKPIGKINLV